MNDSPQDIGFGPSRHCLEEISSNSKRAIFRGDTYSAEGEACAGCTGSFDESIAALQIGINRYDRVSYGMTQLNSEGVS